MPRRGASDQSQAAQNVTAPHSSSRIFCAIELPNEVRRLVSGYIARLRAQVPNARASWSREENLHLTLKFLGEISQTRIEHLSPAVRRTAAGLSPFTLIVAGAGSFPAKREPRVLRIGITDRLGNLDRLHRQLEAECANEGFAIEDRPYHPHLTLARIRQTQGARALASAHQENGFDPIEFSVSDLLIIQSELSSRGSKYTVVSRHLLTGDAAGPPAFEREARKAN